MPIEFRSQKWSPRHSSSGVPALETDWLVLVALTWQVLGLARFYNIVATSGKDTTDGAIPQPLHNLTD